MPAFDPARCVGEQRERGCVTFRKPIRAEAFELREGLLGTGLRVAIRDHAGDQLVAELRNPAGVLERRHAAPEPVGFTRGKAGTFDRDAHRLFLKQRHTERLAEHPFQLRFRIRDRLDLFPPAQIGMHHVALDRAGAHDRHFDDQIVEGFGLNARQHRHLRTRFDLEHADRVGLLDHRVGLGVLGRDRREIETYSLVLVEQIEGAPQTAEHAEAEHVHLHEVERGDVVLVPFDDSTALHCGRLDRHEFVEPVPRQHETTWMR
jgi:hypothetical protein